MTNCEYSIVSIGELPEFTFTEGPILLSQSSSEGTEVFRITEFIYFSGKIKNIGDADAHTASYYYEYIDHISTEAKPKTAVVFLLYDNLDNLIGTQTIGFTESTIEPGQTVSLMTAQTQYGKVKPRINYVDVAGWEYYFIYSTIEKEE